MYIYEIKNTLFRRCMASISIIALIVLIICFFITYMICDPKQPKVHANFLTALFTDSVMSMWNGVPHCKFKALELKYYHKF